MSFSESARRLAAQVMERRSLVKTEEAVKQALILPFLHLLGFDIYDPREVIPEYGAGFARATEKIDYALSVRGRLAILVEAKGPNEELGNHDPQLAKYFNSTPEVKFGIITNGVRYRFFTDLEQPNLLDKRPFFETDLERLNEAEISILEKFRKDVFDVNSLVSYAEDLVYLTKLKTEFMRLLREPSDDFIRFAIKSADVVTGNVWQKHVDRFRPLVRDGISAAILEIVGQSFTQERSTQAPERAEASGAAEARDLAEPAAKAEPITASEQELNAFNLIRATLADEIPDSLALSYRPAAQYFAVLCGHPARWFARLIMPKSSPMSVIVPLPVDQAARLVPDFKVVEPSKGKIESRVYFGSLDALPQLKPVLAAAVQTALDARVSAH
jgi:hypothetical protein